MKRILKKVTLLFMALSGSCTRDNTAGLNVRNLRCEYMNEAVVAKISPRFSWELVSNANGQHQTAWQVIVSDDIKIIKTGKGTRLRYFTKYHWKARVWDRFGKESGWSETASFITGAFDKKERKADWIADRPEPPLEYPLLYKHIDYQSSYSDKENDEKWVEVDLGKSVLFDKIRLYPSCNNIKKISDYYFPLAYRIELSKDGYTVFEVQSGTYLPTSEMAGDPRWVKIEAGSLVQH